MVNAQTWLDKNYPQENRKNVKEIEVESVSDLTALLLPKGRSSRERSDLKHKEYTQTSLVEGFLNLNDFTSLEELDCSSNLLTKLTVSKCPNLRVLNCSDNLLTNLIIKHNHKLEELNISNNNFPERDLSFLSHLVNLKTLAVGNVRSVLRIEKDTYNRFEGSLQSLSNLTQLEELDISNTNISGGLEYLPNSVKKISCWSSLGDVEWTVKEIEEKLENYEFYSAGIIDLVYQSRGYAGREGREVQKDFPYRYQAWRKDNSESVISALQKTVVELVKKNTDLEEKNTSLEAELQMEREEAEKALEKAKEWRERQLSEVTEQKDRKIEELKTQLEKLQLQAQIQVSPK